MNFQTSTPLKQRQGPPALTNEFAPGSQNAGNCQKLRSDSSQGVFACCFAKLNSNYLICKRYVSLSFQFSQLIHYAHIMF